MDGDNHQEQYEVTWADSEHHTLSLLVHRARCHTGGELDGAGQEMCYTRVENTRVFICA
jgi:hypothetical protein